MAALHNYLVLLLVHDLEDLARGHHYLTDAFVFQRIEHGHGLLLIGGAAGRDACHEDREDHEFALDKAIGRDLLTEVKDLADAP